MQLRDYTRVIWRWWWLIVLGVAAATGSAYLALRDQPPQYEATARLMVGQGLEQQQPSETDVLLGERLAESYQQIAMGRLVREATQSALGLSRLPEYSAEPVLHTQLLDIVVTDSDPQRSAAVANELAKQLILQSPTNSSADETQRREFIQRQLDGLEENIDATQAEIDKQKVALGKMLSAREIVDTQNQIAALQRKLNDFQLNYGQLMAVMGQGAVNSLSILEPAVPPRSPIGPAKTRTLLLVAAVGLGLAVATAFLLEYLDDTIKTPDDVDRTMHTTTLASISRIGGKSRQEQVIAARHPKSPISEAYRVLRTNLQFASLDKPLRTLLVTSPTPVEGKSTTVANLGVVMAQAGKKVILVDADLGGWPPTSPHRRCTSSLTWTTARV
jgi:tyrosine-protein kinase